jgi:ribonuclease D
MLSIVNVRYFKINQLAKQIETMTYHYYQHDIPEHLITNEDIAIDTEAMGLNPHRDRLCVLQFSIGDKQAHVVHFPTPDFTAPNLKRLLQSEGQKIFHFARFDLAIIQHYLGIRLKNIFCTKIASKLCRTFTDSHGLKELCSEFLDIKLNKQQQSSDWGASSLTPEQVAYAAADVLYLHQIRDKLCVMLEREKRMSAAQSCFHFLPTRAELDLMGWPENDIFQH